MKKTLLLLLAATLAFASCSSVEEAVTEYVPTVNYTLTAQLEGTWVYLHHNGSRLDVKQITVDELKPYGTGFYHHMEDGQWTAQPQQYIVTDSIVTFIFDNKTTVYQINYVDDSKLILQEIDREGRLGAVETAQKVKTDHLRQLVGSWRPQNDDDAGTLTFDADSTYAFVDNANHYVSDYRYWLYGDLLVTEYSNGYDFALIGFESAEDNMVLNAYESDPEQGIRLYKVKYTQEMLTGMWKTTFHNKPLANTFDSVCVYDISTDGSTFVLDCKDFYQASFTLNNNQIVFQLEEDQAPEEVFSIIHIDDKSVIYKTEDGAIYTLSRITNPDRYAPLLMGNWEVVPIYEQINEKYEYHVQFGQCTDMASILISDNSTDPLVFQLSCCVRRNKSEDPPFTGDMFLIDNMLFFDGLFYYIEFPDTSSMVLTDQNGTRITFLRDYFFEN